MAEHQVLRDALADKLNKSWQDILEGKGGFWVKGDRFYSYRETYKLTGMKPPTRHCDRVVMRAWGDYATIAQINRVRY